MNKTTPQNSQQKLHGQTSWNRWQLSGVDREEVDKRSVFGQPRHQLRARRFFLGFLFCWPKQTCRVCFFRWVDPKLGLPRSCDDDCLGSFLLDFLAPNSETHDFRCLRALQHSCLISNTPRIITLLSWMGSDIFFFGSGVGHFLDTGLRATVMTEVCWPSGLWCHPGGRGDRDDKWRHLIQDIMCKYIFFLYKYLRAANRQTDKQTTQTDRRMDRQTERQNDIIKASFQLKTSEIRKSQEKRKKSKEQKRKERWWRKVK